MIRRLFVAHASGQVGLLEQEASGQVRFRYAESWLDSSSRFPVSAALPLRPEVFGAEAQSFFSNLLPEGETRTLLCRRLGISVDNDFALLAAIGGECAGALTLLPDNGQPPVDDQYRPLSRSELRHLAVTQALPAVDGRAGLRLSLAGAQDKLPVKVEGEEFLLPVGSSPSTHILKFPNRRFAHLPANEVFAQRVAHELGMPVAQARLLPLGKQDACLVTRYDRVVDSQRRIIRLHQEDFCQALGFAATAKYEKEGGPTLVRCFDLVRRTSTDPLHDGRSLLQWIVFNSVFLNADGHAKNLSLLYTPAGTRLAPFYDLLCTRAYPSVAQELAMSVGGVAEPTNLRRETWERLAEDLGVGTRLILETVREIAERIPDALRDAAVELGQGTRMSPAVQLVVPKVRRQARRVLQQLGAR